MRARSAWILLVTLCAMRLGAQAPSSATVLRPGSRIRIDAPGVVKNRFVGTLLMPPSDSLLLSNEDGPPVAVRPAQITSVEVSQGRSSRDGAIRGVMVGAPLGLTLGLLLTREPEKICDTCPIRRNRHGPGLVTMLGAGVGMLAGALVARERWARVPIGQLTGR